MEKLISRFLLAGIIFTTHSFSGSAQSITGRWEGIMADEILQVNIIQKGNTICGFSYDFKIDNPQDLCKAYFTGSYESDKKSWFLKGFRFIENSGSHVLMAMRLSFSKVDGKTVIKGYVMPKSSLNNLTPVERIPVELRREYISDKELASLRKICFPQEDEAPAAVSKKKKNEIIKQPVDSISPAEQVKDKTADTGSSSQLDLSLPVPVTKSVTDDRTKEAGKRKMNEVSSIKVTTRLLNIKVYDNGTIDNDTVTIFYNKKLLVNRQRLSDKPIELNIELELAVDNHEIIMYADNLGNIPPNTALVIVTAGDKRYELFSSASLEENAVLRFEYQP